MSTINKSFTSFGVVTSVGCGVVILNGMHGAFVGEQFICTYRNRKSYGQVVNLNRIGIDEVQVAGILVDPQFRLSPGSVVQGRNSLFAVILGYSAVGSLLDPAGGYIFQGDGKIVAESAWLVEAAAPSIIARQSIVEPL